MDIFTTFIILRPKIATLRLYLVAVSTTCCMRCTFEEKVAIIMRFLALRKGLMRFLNIFAPHLSDFYTHRNKLWQD